MSANYQSKRHHLLSLSAGCWPVVERRIRTNVFRSMNRKMISAPDILQITNENLALFAEGIALLNPECALHIPPILSQQQQHHCSWGGKDKSENPNYLWLPSGGAMAPASQPSIALSFHQISAFVVLGSCFRVERVNVNVTAVPAGWRAWRRDVNKEDEETSWILRILKNCEDYHSSFQRTSSIPPDVVLIFHSHQKEISRSSLARVRI